MANGFWEEGAEAVAMLAGEGAGVGGGGVTAGGTTFLAIIVGAGIFSEVAAGGAGAGAGAVIFGALAAAARVPKVLAMAE